MATGIGETLRAAREQRGLSLSDVAEDTAISKRKLQALEEEHFAALEGDVYVKSSLRLYGRFLQIDPEPLVEAYRREYGEVAAQAPVQPVGEYRERVSPVVAFAVVAFVAVVGLGLIGWLNGGAETPSDTIAVVTETDEGVGAAAPDPAPTPEPTAEPTGQPTAEPEQEPTPEPTPTAEPEAEATPPLAEADEVQLALQVSGGASWVRVSVDDQTVLERTLEDGFSETFTGDEIQMRIGNGGATEVVVNGEELAGFSSGEVVDLVCAAGQSSCTVE